MKQTATLRYLHIAPRKVRLLASTLKNLPVQEAEAQLMLRTQRSAKPLLKLIRSAVANATTNQKAKADTLFVTSVIVDPGPIMKRSLPRAMGRATPIHKKISHVTVTLEDRPSVAQRFVIQPPAKKEKKEKKPKQAKAEPKPGAREMKGDKPREQGGFFKKIFNRKSV